MGAGTPRALGSPLPPVVPVRAAPGAALEDHLAAVERGGRADGEPLREGRAARAELAPRPGGPLPPASRPARAAGCHRYLVHSGRPLRPLGRATEPLPAPVPDVRLATPGLGRS
ncbi:hypothetical protein [Amycolatopsis mediterranei]|uniref:Uncharacterized protein n=1 Tax=Amycolatopsis mediterranei (strain S699) TaxID=713604 RepID=A0A9R0NXV4_AMYMS|nr:hypothetical protein [Amycolatopsis mediterranei]AEK42646.1 hypothetical protein RAM_20830 [Amycolatopsis mediterranei S699]KDO05400.1 hypothetical protein DV26_37825 [Amycolatopsis mediterranei]KDU88194.1 hypothetical protein DV36_31765 [Amycolatopsis mediterranei]UZF71128.1 hypothetical protein ISP_004378 [Amycolatopsis mediterranei]